MGSGCKYSLWPILGVYLHINPYICAPYSVCENKEVSSERIQSQTGRITSSGVFFQGSTSRLLAGGDRLSHASPAATLLWNSHWISTSSGISLGSRSPEGEAQIPQSMISLQGHSALVIKYINTYFQKNLQLSSKCLTVLNN